MLSAHPERTTANMAIDKQRDNLDATDGPQPLVDVDEARKRPKTVDAGAPDVGGVADHFTDSSENVVDGDFTGKEDGLPGDDTAIFQRGATIIPPS